MGVIGYVLYKILWKGEGIGLFRSRKKAHPQNAIEEMKKDPVCGTYIPENQAIKYRMGSETYYFCSEECKQAFRELKT